MKGLRDKGGVQFLDGPRRREAAKNRRRSDRSACSWQFAVTRQRSLMSCYQFFDATHPQSHGRKAQRDRSFINSHT